MKLTKREEILLAIFIVVLILSGSYFAYTYYQKIQKQENTANNLSVQSLSEPVKTGDEAELDKMKKDIDEPAFDMTELDTLSTELGELDLSSL